MIRRICPICDQVMKGAHYCRNCRSWVKKPYVRDVNYYLNERHPQGETDCSFHGRGVLPGRAVIDSRAGGGRAAVRGVPGGRPTGGGVQTDTAGWVAREGERVTGLGVVWVAVFLVGLVAAASVVIMGTRAIKGDAQSWMEMDGLSEYVEQLDPKDIESDYDEDWDYDDDWDYDYFDGDFEDDRYRELTDEEAKATGGACSEENHFGVSAKEVEEPVRQLLERSGCRIEDIERYSYNNAYCDEKGNIDKTYFSTYISFNLEGENRSIYEYVEIDCDTVTDELHGFQITMGNKEKMAEVLDGICNIMEEKGGSSWRDCGENVRRRFSQDVELEEGYDYMSEDIWICGYSYDYYYTVFIDAIQ